MVLGVMTLRPLANLGLGSRVLVDIPLPSLDGGGKMIFAGGILIKQNSNQIQAKTLN